MSAFYNIETNEIVDIDPAVYSKWQADRNPKAARFAPLPAKPAYNPATQKPPVFQNGAWAVPSKSAEELAAEADAAAATEETRQIRLIVAALKAGTGTAAERLARLERAVAHLIKQSLQ